MSKLIMISGKMGSGKTTLLKNLEAWAISNDIMFVGIKFADPLYQMHNEVLEVLDHYGFQTPEKDGTLLQLLGTEWGRKVYGEDIWVRIAKTRVQKEMDFWKDKGCECIIVLDDCRFPNELAAFPEALKVRLHADRDVRKDRAEAWRENETHASEIALDEIGPDAWDFLFYTNPAPRGVSAEEIVRLLVEKLELHNANSQEHKRP